MQVRNVLLFNNYFSGIAIFLFVFFSFLVVRLPRLFLSQDGIAQGGIKMELISYI